MPCKQPFPVAAVIPLLRCVFASPIRLPLTITGNSTALKVFRQHAQLGYEDAVLFTVLATAQEPVQQWNDFRAMQGHEGVKLRDAGLGSRRSAECRRDSANV